MQKETLPNKLKQPNSHNTNYNSLYKVLYKAGNNNTYIRQTKKVKIPPMVLIVAYKQLDLFVRRY